jgi:hypothetical protein
MPRYCIKHPDGSYYTEMRSVETKPVTLRGQVVGHEDTYRPLFEAPQPRWACFYATRKDCEDLMQNPEYGGPSSFEGCVVVEVLNQE